jgi:hypothetical protein
MRPSLVITTAMLLSLVCAPASATGFGKRGVCYVQRDGDIALNLVLETPAALTSSRATPQTTYNAHGKIVNGDDTILPIDGSVLVGDGKNAPKGSYMNLETGNVRLECVAAQPSSTPATWTCVPQTADGASHIIETFDLAKANTHCDRFVTPTIPTTSLPPEPVKPVPNPGDPNTHNPSDGLFAHCTSCNMLACLLSPTEGDCSSSAEVCYTQVIDKSAGREITRGCVDPKTWPDTNSGVLGPDARNAQCNDIETRVLSSGVTCRYACDGKAHPNCNAPPQLLPDLNTQIPMENLPGASDP